MCGKEENVALKQKKQKLKAGKTKTKLYPKYVNFL